MATPVRFGAKPRTSAAPRTTAAKGVRVGAAKGGGKPSGTQWASIREGGGGGYNPKSTYADIPD